MVIKSPFLQRKKKQGGMEKNNYRRIRVGSRDEVVERWGDKVREVLVRYGKSINGE